MWRPDAMGEASPAARGVADRDVVRVGVLGLAGVGKSSLVNALLTPGIQLMPAGGIGALSGAAVRLTYHGETELRVTYRARAWFEERLRELRAGAMDDASLRRLSLLGKEEPRATVDSGWVAQALRYVLAPERTALPTCSAGTEKAIAQLSHALAHPGAEPVVRRRDQVAEFHRQVRAHAAGPLAPFCSEIELGCDAALLAHGIELVDLPGLGSFGDTQAEVARASLDQLDAVVLTVDRSGVPAVVMEALRSSGFLRRWMTGEAQALLAVTKLDEITCSARAIAAVRRRWSDHLRECMGLARDAVRAQARNALAAMAGPGAARALDDREGQVFPVSSHELEALHRGDGEARVQLAESTGIPALRRAIVAMARSRATGWAAAVTNALRSEAERGRRLADLYPEWLNLLDEGI
jgi:Dynamin family